MTQQTESKFKVKVLKDLGQLERCWVLKTQERSRRGVPDLLICLSGVFVAIELKTDTGKLDKLQAVILDRISDAGGVRFVSTPKQWDHHYKLLKIMQQTKEKGGFLGVLN